MSTPYRVAPIFLIRIAGAPFDALDGLATRETSRAARALFNNRDVSVRVRGSQSLSSQEMKLAASLDHELAAARKALLEAARTILPDYLLFASTGGENLLPALSSAEEQSLPPRNSRVRGREQRLLLYLQRICTKNDTFSRFGPTAWGKIDNEGAPFALRPSPGIAMREAFLERWTAQAIAAAMNADPEVFAELSPRLHPNVRINHATVLTENGETAALTPEDFEVISQCDGNRPVHTFADSLERIRALVAQKVLRCEVEIPALEPHVFDVLWKDIEKWRDGEARTRWLSVLDGLGQAPAKFCASTEPMNRQQILHEARARLQTIGATLKAGGRSLYSASNVLAEECSRAGEFRVSEALIDEVPAEAALWIDLWRDSYAFVASRVAAGLRRIFDQAPAGQNGTLPLPAFLRYCEQAKLPLQGPGLVALSVIAFQEVKAAFRERLRPHAGDEEYELTEADCHVVRNTFEYPKFDEYTYPSADLQLAAASSEAVAQNEYQWILAELHPPVALLHHCMYWSCPDKAILNDAFARGVFAKPNFHFGFFPADFTAHTTVRVFDALPELSNFVAPHRGNPSWRTVRPADAEVYVDSETGDIRVRQVGSQRDLGSFARAWVIPLGFHPFQFSLAPHTPRLRCGRVIVQRRTWTVSAAEMPVGNYHGISRDLVVAVEQLRTQRGWPRYIYVRPTEQALRRSGAEGRDKDTKPVFIDLESYLFLEIFHRWLTKSGELEVTEMLPAPDQLLWHEPDGRRTFELRTLIVPGP